MLNVPISLFASAKVVARCSEITVETFLDGVRGGRWRTEVAHVRELARSYTSAAHAHGLESDQAKAAKQMLDRAKERLPGVTLAGRFASRVKGALPQEISGLVAVDLDDLPDPDAARRKLKASPHLLAVWLSCSGRGLWILGRTAPVPTAANYGEAWATVADYAARLLGLTLDAIGGTGKPIFDPCVKNVARLCFVSQDAELLLNSKAEPLDLAKAVHPRKREGGEGELATLHGEDVEESSSEHSAPTPDGCTLHSALGSADRVMALMDADIRARERLEGLPPLVRNAYSRHFDRQFEWAPGTRNTTLANAAPALIRRLSFDVALAVLMAFYDLHHELWGTSRERHEKESRAALTNGLNRLVATLGDRESSLYGRLSTETRRAAYRITRDLARTNDRGDVRAFYLSECELAARIGVSDSAAREILHDFARWEILTLLERGERRTLGKKPRATRWRWNLSVEGSGAR